MYQNRPLPYSVSQTPPPLPPPCHNSAEPSQEPLRIGGENGLEPTSQKNSILSVFASPRLSKRSHFGVHFVSFLLIHIKCAKCTPVQAGALFSAFQDVKITTMSTLFSGCFFECCLGWLVFGKIIQNSLPHDPQGDPFGSSNGPREVLNFSLGPGCSHGMSQACRTWLQDPL